MSNQADADRGLAMGGYRYELHRWRPGLDEDDYWLDETTTVMFIMLNPSTATADEDDPTIRRCMGFAWRWGFDHLVVTNLFAMRATSPKSLKAAEDPVGVGNDSIITGWANKVDMVVAAWGTHGGYQVRDLKVLSLLKTTVSDEIWALGLTSIGRPRHPLYLANDTEPIKIWERPDYE